MAGTIKIQAPWAMKRMETTNEGKVIVSNESTTVDLLPDAPVPEQPPLAQYCVVTDKFRDGGPNFPWSIFVNYVCPVCNQSHRVVLDSVFAPGNKIIQCECGEKITLPLAFKVLE